jgi:hypothetical protein
VKELSQIQDFLTFFPIMELLPERANEILNFMGDYTRLSNEGLQDEVVLRQMSQETGKRKEDLLNLFRRTMLLSAMLKRVAFDAYTKTTDDPKAEWWKESKLLKSWQLLNFVDYTRGRFNGTG